MFDNGRAVWATDKVYSVCFCEGIQDLVVLVSEDGIVGLGMTDSIGKVVDLVLLDIVYDGHILVVSWLDNEYLEGSFFRIVIIIVSCIVIVIVSCIDRIDDW